MLSNDTVQAYFDAQAEHELHIDGCLVGLAATLTYLLTTKQLLRAHVWFPGMDSQCDKFVSTCIACQSNTPQTHREPFRMTDLPEGPWEKVSVDFCGPMASGDLALVFYCQYARYPVVEFVGSTSEKATIPTFRGCSTHMECQKKSNQITDRPSTAINSKNTQTRRGLSTEK